MLHIWIPLKRPAKPALLEIVYAEKGLENRISTSNMADTENFIPRILTSFSSQPVEIDPQVSFVLIVKFLMILRSRSHPFLSRPLFAPLLFPNTSSDARDHCANERTFLSWLRLSIYMSIVSVAIIVSFHLKSQPTTVEKRIAVPVGMIFWVLSMACMASGFANYVKTVTKYSRRQALVQSGWKTQIVSLIGIVAQRQ